MSIKSLEDKYCNLIEAEEYLKMFVYKLKMPNLLNALNDVANERIAAGKEYGKVFRNIEVTFEEVKPLNQPTYVNSTTHHPQNRFYANGNRMS